MCHLCPSTKCNPKPKGLTSAKIRLTPSPVPFLYIFLPVTVKDHQNLTNWKSAFFDRSAPYLTDSGFPNPPCFSEDGASRMNAHVRGGSDVSTDNRSLRNYTSAGTYVIGGDDDCMQENNTDRFCNGPLKPNTVYV